MLLRTSMLKTDWRRPMVAATFFAAAIAICGSTENLKAQEGAAVVVTMKEHRFQPAEIYAPANRRLAITVKNLDGAPIEFESVSLRVEKVIASGSAGVVNVRALAPGRYEFFDDFHHEARGVLVVE
jgi:hypothetical protein